MQSIRIMTKEDTEKVLEMMRVFYNSDAVWSNGSEEIFKNDIENCVNSCPFLEGYVFTENSSIVGYAMIAKSFSTEFGKRCIWIEDIYIKNGFRGLGFGTKFFKFIEEKYSDCVLRLEVEEDNQTAIGLYRKSGFEILPYMEMIKNIK